MNCPYVTRVCRSYIAARGIFMIQRETNDGAYKNVKSQIPYYEPRTSIRSYPQEFRVSKLFLPQFKFETVMG